MSHKQIKGKLKLRLVPPRAIESIALVRAAAGEKYDSPWGWLESVAPEDFIEATARHLLAMQKLDDIAAVDEDFGLLHIEHALTSLAMAVELVKRGTEGYEATLERLRADHGIIS